MVFRSNSYCYMLHGGLLRVALCVAFVRCPAQVRSLLADYKIAMCDLAPYLPVDPRETAALRMDLQYLGYYLPWDPQEAYYYSVENVGFEANKVLSVLCGLHRL